MSTEPGPRTVDAGEESDEPARLVDAARVAQRLGRYQLVLPLASGGMGVVFAARLVGVHGVERLVAIKTLRPITSRSDRTALLREARLTARLHHRNVVATIDLGEVEDVPYVVMELVDGVSLAQLLGALDRAEQRFEPTLAAWIVMQAALGLHAAHELADPQGDALGLVHRDVSPQNILLSLDGQVKIADFGIAKFAGREESTATGLIKGKFAYMSPEQASDVELDRRTDVFALGVVFWEALTGARLFASDSPARTIMRVLEHRPRPPHELFPSIGEELSAIALRCLAKDRDDRFPSAAAVAEALRSALRARGSPVDEGDLAGVVRAHFGEERAAFMAKLNDPDAGITTTVTAGPPVTGRPIEPSGLTDLRQLSVSSSVRRITPERKRSPLVLVVVGVVVLGAIAGVGYRLRGGTAPAASTPAAGGTSTGEASQASTVDPSAAVTSMGSAPPARVSASTSAAATTSAAAPSIAPTPSTVTSPPAAAPTGDGRRAHGSRPRHPAPAAGAPASSAAGSGTTATAPAAAPPPPVSSSGRPFPTF